MLSRVFLKSNRLVQLQTIQQRSILYSTKQPYDKRWQHSFNHAYFVEPEISDPTGRPKPEDSPEYGSFLGSFIANYNRRFHNVFTMLWARRNRIYNPFDFVVLPVSTLFFMQFWSLGMGFKGLTLLPLLSFYTRCRDKVKDPEFPETYLRDMIQNNPELKKYFTVDTMQTMDFEFDFIPGFPDAVEFPEYSNKLFSLLNRILQQ